MKDQRDLHELACARVGVDRGGRVPCVRSVDRIVVGQDVDGEAAVVVARNPEDRLFEAKPILGAPRDDLDLGVGKWTAEHVADRPADERGRTRRQGDRVDLRGAGLGFGNVETARRDARHRHRDLDRRARDCAQFPAPVRRKRDRADGVARPRQRDRDTHDGRACARIVVGDLTAQLEPVCFAGTLRAASRPKVRAKPITKTTTISSRQMVFFVIGQLGSCG
jgi:hypothetical protein